LVSFSSQPHTSQASSALNTCVRLVELANPALTLTHLIDPEGFVIKVERHYEGRPVFVVVAVKNDMEVGWR
jgi:hypothetical protein